MPLRWEEVHSNLPLIMLIQLICGSNRMMHPSQHAGSATSTTNSPLHPSSSHPAIEDVIYPLAAATRPCRLGSGWGTSKAHTLKSVLNVSYATCKFYPSIKCCNAPHTQTRGATRMRQRDHLSQLCCSLKMPRTLHPFEF
jgi:hypothetical protein